MFPWVKRAGLASLLSMTISVSQANSQEFAPRVNAREILESLSGPTSSWAGLLAFRQERPINPGSTREPQGLPREIPNNRGGARPNNPEDNGQQRATEIRQPQRQAELQRQKAEEEMRRAQETRERENRDREVQARNSQREHMAQEAQNLEKAMGDHQRALQEISARLDEIRKRMRENQEGTGPRRVDFTPLRPNPNQPGREQFGNPRREHPQWEEVLRRLDRQLDQQNAKIQGLEEQVRDLRNRDRSRQPGFGQFQSVQPSQPQIIVIPFHPGMMAQFGNLGPNPPQHGYHTIPSGVGPGSGNPFAPNYGPPPFQSLPSQPGHTTPTPQHYSAPTAPVQRVPQLVPAPPVPLAQPVPSPNPGPTQQRRTPPPEHRDDSLPPLE